MSRLFIIIQHLLPHHLFSRLVAWFMGRRLWKNLLISTFARRYQVNFAEAERERPDEYASFNDFFTRRLKAGVRPLPTAADIVIQPADGAISQLGAIRKEQIFQAKGHNYSCQALLACSNEVAAQYHNGSFATVYLSPKDYHRVHMPYTGVLRSMTYVPGRLFSVNPATAAAVPGLFARNERVVCQFDTDIGPMAVVLVGAMIVASIETVWAGQICPGRDKPGLARTVYSGDDAITLKTGDELGLFKTGSTVIVLFAENALRLQSNLGAGTKVQMGQPLGNANTGIP